jgi:hypothetical protein
LKGRNRQFTDAITSGYLAVGRLLVLFLLRDELLLLARFRLPEKTAGLVTDRLRGKEAAGSDLFFESFDVGGSELAGVAA